MTQEQNYSLFDTHCHLDFEVFDACRAHEIQEAHSVGVEYLFVPSIGQSNWDKVAQLAQTYPNLYYGLGLHPYFIDKHGPDALAELNQALFKADENCVALGECGLDFQLAEPLMTPELIAKQHRLFEGQVDLAKQHQLAMVLHSRKSHDKIAKQLRKKQINRGVIHAFSGSYQQAKAYLDLGFYIGVGGIITYPRAKKTRDVIAKLPLDCMVLETDAPDMPLAGFQGQANRVCRIKLILDEICTLRGQKPQFVSQQILENSKRLFLLS
ncbi:MAG: TatD family hydrolase [Vibrio sp.]